MPTPEAFKGLRLRRRAWLCCAELEVGFADVGTADAGTAVLTGTVYFWCWMVSEGLGARV